MKSVFTILLLLCGLLVNAQQPKNKYVTISGEAGIVRGSFRVDGALLVADDTLNIPPSIEGRQAIAGKGDSLYRYSYVHHKWQLIPNRIIPNDKSLLATIGGSNLNNAVIGNPVILLPDFAGFRVRVYRNYLLQDTQKITSGDAETYNIYYSYDLTTGTITLYPAPSAEEVFQIQPY